MSSLVLCVVKTVHIEFIDIFLCGLICIHIKAKGRLKNKHLQ